MNKLSRLSSVTYVAILVALPLCTPSADLDNGRNTAQQTRPSTAGQRSPSESDRGLYDSNPDHISNRLYRALFIRVAGDGREYGYDELDPLLWSETKHLLSGPSNQDAIRLLEEFLATDAERLIREPLKRAMLQRDLWAVFDWSTLHSYQPTSEKRELVVKLAQVIRRLALTREQIEALPHNYTEAVAAKSFAGQYDSSKPDIAFLPPELFRSDGPWVALSVYGGAAIALDHVFAFSGRSVFRVFIRLPAGRKATLAYIKKLAAFSQQWLPDSRDPDRQVPNPALPQFPAGTQLALVREMMLIDDQANLRPTRLTEDLQIRVHRAIPTTIPEGVDLDSNEALSAMNVFEFRLSRARIFAGVAGGLRAVARDEKEFTTFHSHGFDPFDPRPDATPIERHMGNVLNSCALCHFRPGIHSVLSRGGSFTPQPRRLALAWQEAHEANATVQWKHGKYNWGLLRGLWESQPSIQRR